VSFVQIADFVEGGEKTRRNWPGGHQKKGPIAYPEGSHSSHLRAYIIWKRANESVKKQLARIPVARYTQDKKAGQHRDIENCSFGKFFQKRKRARKDEGVLSRERRAGGHNAKGLSESIEKQTISNCQKRKGEPSGIIKKRDRSRPVVGRKKRHGTEFLSRKWGMAAELAVAKRVETVGKKKNQCSPQHPRESKKRKSDSFSYREQGVAWQKVAGGLFRSDRKGEKRSATKGGREVCKNAWET